MKVRVQYVSNGIYIVQARCSWFGGWRHVKTFLYNRYGAEEFAARATPNDIETIWRKDEEVYQEERSRRATKFPTIEK